ncbi:MAG: PqqD family protein [Myxococcota bacterium]|nr:PqqD family protein [Myxococcota bacterium]
MSKRPARDPNAWVAELMALRLRRNRDDERAEDGRLAILIPKFDGAILGRYLQPRLRQPYFRILIDKLGEAVWRLCDGELSGAEIAAKLEQDFPEEQNCYDRVALFLRTLHGERLVVARRDD